MQNANSGKAVFANFSKPRSLMHSQPFHTSKHTASFASGQIPGSYFNFQGFQVSWVFAVLCETQEVSLHSCLSEKEELTNVKEKD